MSKTYFKIFLNHESFKGRVYPRGLAGIVDSDTYDLIMSFTDKEGKYYFTYQNIKICLVVLPIKQNNNG